MTDLDEYFRAEIPRMRAWASGRVPRAARGAMDTEDVVQETVLRILRAIETIEFPSDGARAAYARTALTNRLRDLYRAAQRTPEVAAFESRDSPRTVSPLRRAMSGQALARYEAALGRLDPEDRVAVMARVELGWKYRQVAELLGLTGDDAARMRVNRALARIKEWMA